MDEAAFVALLQERMPELAEVLKRYTIAQIVALTKAREAVYESNHKYYNQNRAKVIQQKVKYNREYRKRQKIHVSTEASEQQTEPAH